VKIRVTAISIITISVGSIIGTTLLVHNWIWMLILIKVVTYVIKCRFPFCFYFLEYTLVPQNIGIRVKFENTVIKHECSYADHI